MQSTHADTYTAFTEGKFTAKTTGRPFSLMVFDHCNEQLNALMEDDSGVVGLTENYGVLRRWMTCGPEIARLASEFQLNKVGSEKPLKRYEQQPNAQIAFDRCFLGVWQS